jgi:arylsulfatase A-like enzyme/cytochrome c biogenesis protein CcdA
VISITKMWRFRDLDHEKWGSDVLLHTAREIKMNHGGASTQTSVTATDLSKSFVAEVRLATVVGALGGGALGCREALLTLQTNAFVQPDQYLFPYLAAPILSCMALGVVLLCPIALWRWRRRTPQDLRASLRVYCAALGCAATLSVVAPWITAMTAELHAVGATSTSGAALLLWALGVGLTVLAGATGAALGTLLEPCLRWLSRYGVRITLVAGILVTLPLLRFVATDWKWALAPAPRSTASSGQPNVLLISIDTLRADHLGSYGDTRGLTPALDQLASEGVVFEHAFTSAPWTLPAVASLLTGLYPDRHGAGAIVNRRDPLGRSALPDDVATLATLLRAHGYMTHAIVTNPYLALRYGFGRGFDTYDNVTIESETFLVLKDTTMVRLLTWLAPALVVGDRGTTVSARSAHWLTHRSSQRPFFLWLHYIDPHPPYNRAGSTRHKSFRTDSVFAPSAGEIDLTLTSPGVARLRSGEIRLSAEEKDLVRGLYRDEVASVDAAVGTVLGALDASGMRADTLVICVADHGEEFWEHGGVEHGHTVYEELIHLPLILRWPGHLLAGARVSQVVRIVDVLPTALELLGLPLPPSLDGQSLMPVLRGDEPAGRVALVENMLFSEERTGLRTATRKYVRWADGKEEVYDLVSDPGERRDLAGVDGEIEPLRALFAAQRRQQPVTARLGAGPAELLRQLGYLH